jgi:predicted nuclease of predicted toxin-antitoxin system
MKFLLNVNIPPSLCELLDNQGHTSRHISLIGKATAKAIVIIEQESLRIRTLPIKKIIKN